MTFRPQTNRPATLARREALLGAAVALVSERGVGAVTHREVAARAGLPLSATSYFFVLLDGFALQRLAWPRGARDHEALRAAMLALRMAYAVG